MTTINAPSVQQIIADANRGVSDSDEPEIIEPPNTVFQFAAGYRQDNGQWTTEFEVRELTGRDEEAFARIADVGRSLVAMTERGVIRLGQDPATPDRLNSLIGGDWDTMLLAVRSVTFGPTIEIKPTCRECDATYEVTINLMTDLTVRTANPEDLAWTVKGRSHTYEVSLYSGATQRVVFEMMAEGKTVAAINTQVLQDSINRIDGLPVLGRDDVLNISMSDRRLILKSIQERRVGPDLQGVTIKCPTCGHEQSNPLNAAALFQ